MLQQTNKTTTNKPQYANDHFLLIFAIFCMIYSMNAIVTWVKKIPDFTKYKEAILADKILKCFD